MFPRLPRLLRLLLFVVCLSLSVLLLLRSGSGGAPPRHLNPEGMGRGLGGGGLLPHRLPTPILPGGGVPPLTDLKHRLVTTPRQKALSQLGVGGATTVVAGKAGGGGGGVGGRMVLQEKDIVNPHPYKYLLNPGEAACRTSFVNQQKRRGASTERTRRQEDRQRESIRLDANTNSSVGSRGSGDVGGGHGGGDGGGDGGDDPVWLLVYVHSAPGNLKKRQSIRQTWGARDVLDSYNASLVFVLGNMEDPTLSQLVLLENERYGDIVQEDFLDSYRNLTYKAIAGLKWAATFCSEASYILKTDDDILVNLHTLVKHVRGVVAPQYGDKKLILCNQWQRMKIIRDKKSKWYIPEADFPGEYFPPYCSGSAFLLSGDMAQLMYEASMASPFFWVDDYYITGALIKRLNISHRRLNQAYSLNPSVAEGKFRNDTKKELFFFHLHKLRVLYGLWRNMTIPYEAVSSASASSSSASAGTPAAAAAALAKKAPLVLSETNRVPVSPRPRATLRPSSSLSSSSSASRLNARVVSPAARGGDGGGGGGGGGAVARGGGDGGGGNVNDVHPVHDSVHPVQ